MERIARIVAGTDFSPASQLAVNVAFRLGAAFGAHLTLLHVVEELGEEIAVQYFQPMRDKVYQRLSAEAERQLAALRGSFAYGRDHPLKVTTKLAIGRPHDRIHDFAHSVKADLLILGTHSRQGLDRLIVGSVAERVVRRAHCPVLVVKGEQEPRLKRVLAASDLSPASDRATGFAFDVARAFAAEITVLHVMETRLRRFLLADKKEDEVNRMMDDMAADRRRRLAERIATLGGADLNAQPVVISDNPLDGIVSYAETADADLIVMGTHGYGAVKHVLVGSVAERVVRHSRRAVCVVKPEGWEYSG